MYYKRDSSEAEIPSNDRKSLKFDRVKIISALTYGILVTIIGL